MQQTIARRMAESKATIPDFTLQADVDMEECVKLRAQLKAISSEDAPTYNDMVVKACALALREHPRANGSYKDGALQLHSRVNVGVAVAAQDALVVPTVFDADSKALGEIAREARALAARVRDGSITPPELGGGTFTVSNLGMYGIKSFNAIINPPQAAILSVGSVEQRVVVRDGGLTPRHTMTLTLVCDHRILYGADAAEFLARIRELLQAPCLVDALSGAESAPLADGYELRRWRERDAEELHALIERNRERAREVAELGAGATQPRHARIHRSRPRRRKRRSPPAARDRLRQLDRRRCRAVHRPRQRDRRDRLLARPRSPRPRRDDRRRARARALRLRRARGCTASRSAPTCSTSPAAPSPSGSGFSSRACCASLTASPPITTATTPSTRCSRPRRARSAEQFRRFLELFLARLDL